MARDAPEAFTVWDGHGREVVVGGFDARPHTYYWRCQDCDESGTLFPMLAQAMEEAAIHLATAVDPAGPVLRRPKKEVRP